MAAGPAAERGDKKEPQKLFPDPRPVCPPYMCRSALWAVAVFAQLNLFHVLRIGLYDLGVLRNSIIFEFCHKAVSKAEPPVLVSGGAWTNEPTAAHVWGKRPRKSREATLHFSLRSLRVISLALDHPAPPNPRMTLLWM